MTALLRQAQATFNPDEQTQLLAKAHAMVVDGAPWLFIVHDLNPRAMSKKVSGVQTRAKAQWAYHDFTQIRMA